MPARPEEEPTMNWRTYRVGAWVLGSAGILGLLYAANCWLFAVILENACFLGREGACDALHRTLRFAFLVALGSVTMIVAAIVSWRRARAGARAG
jgi:hypothetical protein